MNRKLSIFFFVAVIFGIATMHSAQASLTTLGEVGDWHISGANGQCQAGKLVLRQSSIGQFAIGISSPEGTFMTLQQTSWGLTPNSRNMMNVNVYLDGSRVFRSEALVVNRVTFQIFLKLTNLSEQEFWEKVLKAGSIRVTGDFKPSIEIDLKDLNRTIPTMKKCATKYLRGVQLPFSKPLTQEKKDKANQKPKRSSPSIFEH